MPNAAAGVTLDDRPAAPRRGWARSCLRARKNRVGPARSPSRSGLAGAANLVARRTRPGSTRSRTGWRSREPDCSRSTRRPDTASWSISVSGWCPRPAPVTAGDPVMACGLRRYRPRQALCRMLAAAMTASAPSRRTRAISAKSSAGSGRWLEHRDHDDQVGGGVVHVQRAGLGDHDAVGAVAQDQADRPAFAADADGAAEALAAQQPRQRRRRGHVARRGTGPRSGRPAHRSGSQPGAPASPADRLSRGVEPVRHGAGVVEEHAVAIPGAGPCQYRGRSRKGKGPQPPVTAITGYRRTAPWSSRGSCQCNGQERTAAGERKHSD